MIYCCNKSYAMISKLTLVTLSFIPRGTSYHSYLIQNCKICDCSLSVKWTPKYMTQLLINVFVFSWKLSLGRNMCQGKAWNLHTHIFCLRVWRLSSLSQNCSKRKQSLNSIGQNSDHFCDTVFCPQGRF